MDTIEAQEIKWLWPGRIPAGKLSLIVGEPSEGKSCLSLWLASMVSSGGEMPDCPGRKFDQGNVLLIGAEDDPADTIRPRLEANGAELGRVGLFFVKGKNGEERLLSLMNDLPLLREQVIENKAKLLIIDPLNAYLGGGLKLDANSDMHIREVLTPVVQMAGELNVAVVCIKHLNKKEDLSAISRVGGSIAFVGIARAVWLVKSSRDSRELRFLQNIKFNCGRPGPGLAFKIGDDPSTNRKGIVEFVDYEQVPEAGILLSRDFQENESNTVDARTWLRQFLAEGSRRSTEVYEAGKEEGYSDKTLLRASKKIEVKKRKKGPVGSGYWEWSLN
jgi:hypothetical protein